MAKNYKIFVSHSWTYTEDLIKLRNLLENRGYFNVTFQEATRDTPINSTNAYYVKQRLKDMIYSSDVVLAIAGVYATHSEWMTWELQTAKELRIPIIGVVPQAQERISAMVSGYSIENVRWNTESMVDAIRRHA